MVVNPFLSSRFLGFVNEVTPHGVCIHFPAAWLLSQFRVDGEHFPGGNVGEFVVIEGDRFGFVAKISSLRLPDSERKELSEASVREENSTFHPIAEAELLASFNMSEPEKAERTASRFPEIGARVYACPTAYVREMLTVQGEGDGGDNGETVAEIGRLVSNGVAYSTGLDSLFGRHCAVVGTTGSGKSHTVATLIEAVMSNSSAKIILLDPTGEYAPFDVDAEHVCSKVMGVNCHFPYRRLRVVDLFYLLRPTAQSQRPTLAHAINSLKTVPLLLREDKLKWAPYLVSEGVLKKSGLKKRDLDVFQYQHINEIETGYCDFDITKLCAQIKNECVYDSDKNDSTIWGGVDQKTSDFQSSLKLRVQELITSKEFDSLFNLKGRLGDESVSVVDICEEFLKSENGRVLRLDFSQTSSSFSAREIVANSVARYFYERAKKGDFKAAPIIFILDEAHLFVNKRLQDAESNVVPLDTFDLIAKECRKFGLFLCLATQMPRDIPVGTLSQVGAFFVHRLINEQDRRTVEMACSSAARSSFEYLPSLGPGEALVTGVDMQMPLMVKISYPVHPPDSSTPKLESK